MADISSHGGEAEARIEPLRGNNIVLIGMRGSGKSTIAQLLKVATGKRVIDTDALIEAKEGKPISEIVAEKGEEYFRDLETDALQEASKESNVIIATGGGAVERPRNMEFLRKNSLCVWLQATLPEMVHRTRDKTNLFPLTAQTNPEAEIEEVMKRRKHMYQKAADVTVTTEGKSAQLVAEEVLRKFKERKA
jgi:shikimate kinase